MVCGARLLSASEAAKEHSRGSMTGKGSETWCSSQKSLNLSSLSCRGGSHSILSIVEQCSEVQSTWLGTGSTTSCGTLGTKEENLSLVGGGGYVLRGQYK